jgi:hypothetical protein
MEDFTTESYMAKFGKDKWLAVDLMEQLEHPMLENARNGLKAVRATLRG